MFQPSETALGDLVDPRRLDALLRLARLSRGHPLDEVLHAVANVFERVVGFAMTAVNVYRPAWDDYEIVLVHGSSAARDTLLHVITPRTLWEQDLLRPEYERVPGAFFIPAENEGAWDSVETMYTPELWELGPADDDHPDRWRPEDAVFLSLTATDGSMLGVLSLDAPSTGRRPTDTDLRVLVAVASHAALALESATAAAEADRHRRVLAGLLEVSGRLWEQTTRDGVLAEVTRSIVSDLGFQQATVLIRSGEEMLRWPFDEGARRSVGVPVKLVEDIFRRRTEDGCVLVRPEELWPPAAPSRMSGRGPHAWHDHRLVVPVREGLGQLAGMLVLDDPDDRLLPRPERRQALRLLADRAAAALESIGRQSHLIYLASHDPLTGVRNRRELDDTIEALAAGPGGVSLLLCDLDHFKQVNDAFGHDTGDQVLECFGQVLRAHSRADDVPFRVGGEEFCLLLPRIDADGAMVAGERLRRAAGAAMSDLVPGSTVSIGIATSHPGLREASRLMEAADRALYAAKAAGRNQCRLAGDVREPPRATYSTR
jgi:diguanylate cyclase (GGDEF)-like protein